MNNLLNYLSKEEYNTIKDEKNLYKKALSLVSILFKNKLDKEGEPYLNHLIRVSNNVENGNTKVAALLHDTVEDIASVRYKDLIEIGFPKEIVYIVKIVTTEDKEKSYHDKITSIIDSNNIEAIKLKYADMCDNSDPKRIVKLDPETQEKFHKKYDEELKRLKEKIERSGRMEKIIKVGVGVMIKDGNKILLGHRSAKRKDTGGIYEPDTWTLPGGKQEYDETVIETAIREIKEETNLTIKNPEVYSVSDDYQEDRHFVTIEMITSDYKGKVKTMEPEKEDEWKWFDLDDLPENIYSPSRVFIEKYKENRK